MSLSKVYRGGEAGDLQQFQFRSFGEPESPAPRDPSAAPQPASAPPPAPAPDAGRQLEDAYARGREEGLSEAEQRLETATRALTQAAEEVCRLRTSLARTGSQDMLRLVMAVAEQVVRKSLEIDQSLVLGIIENALQSSVRADSLRIRINPRDLELVTRQKPLFLASVSGLQNLSIETDPAISPGGCQVDSELGDVDATLETQFDAIQQALSAAIAEG